VSATGDDIARIEGLVPKLYRKIFEAMPDAAVIRSLRTGCYIAANHGFEELTGYRPEDVIGRTPSEVDLWVDRAVYEAGLDVLQRSGVVHNTEARFRRRDGGITIGLVSAVRLDIDGERFIVSFVRDITEVGARNALSLAQNFVDAARIEGGALEVERVPASMNEVVTRVVADQEVTARTRAVEIRASLAEDAPPVAFDVPLIERVLANLISNAVKYSPEGQAVTVTTAAGPGVVRVSVADRGPGIPANRRASLFTRYGLGEARTSDSTGLGLFVVHTFVSAHGGRVSLECPDSGGSVFTVELPA
jgi:PAS domain S-box-containing protein